MRVKLRMTPEEVLEQVTASVTLARNHAEDVEWSAEDGSRSEDDFLCRCVEAAIKAGATTINIPDTVGYAVPEDLTRIFTMLRERVPGAEKVIFSTHNHNDLGMAVANAIAAIRAGARQVECTINGIGERAGNASLEEVVMAMRTRHDAIGLVHQVNTPRILKTSRLLSAITGFDVQPNKAIVGRNAFAHESGIHQDGVLKDAKTYEIMTPESVGWSKSSLVMGKHSGRAAFRDKLRSLGYELGDNALNDAFRRFKEVADRKKVVFDEDIIALVDDEMARANERVQLVDLTVATGMHTKPSATVVLEVDGTRREASALRRRGGGRHLRRPPRGLPARGGAEALRRAGGDGRQRRPSAGDGAAGGRRQAGGRAGGGYRHHRRLCPRLCACAEQAVGQAPAHRPAGAGGCRPVITGRARMRPLPTGCAARRAICAQLDWGGRGLAGRVGHAGGRRKAGADSEAAAVPLAHGAAEPQGQGSAHQAAGQVPWSAEPPCCAGRSRWAMPSMAAAGPRAGPHPPGAARRAGLAWLSR